VEGYLSGVIEGFYGNSWSWRDRHSTVDFLSQCGLASYIYAPKSDPYLRRSWCQSWPRADFEQLQQLAAHCRSSGVLWGLGLSPFEAYIDYGSRTRERLGDKLAEINQLHPDVLCILFDDMRGDIADLAALQVRICEDIAAMSNAQRIIMCPTYYSNDPVLERVFGSMPDNYWVDLGRELAADIDFFWTGEQVCSPAYSRESVADITEAMARAPVLWDNYPVNDGAKMCRKLHLRPFKGRPGDRELWLRGHLANPMNQPWLSRIPLCTMFNAQSPGQDFASAVRQQCPESLAQLLERDVALFQDQGLDCIAEAQRQQLLRDYDAIAHPCAREVSDWLRGAYAFDPACLTD
jgi:hyaluronoglucosaminidase